MHPGLCVAPQRKTGKGGKAGYSASSLLSTRPGGRGTQAITGQGQHPPTVTCPEAQDGRSSCPLQPRRHTPEMRASLRRQLLEEWLLRSLVTGWTAMTKRHNDSRHPRGQVEGVKTEDRQRNPEQRMGGRMSHGSLTMARSVKWKHCRDRERL